MICSYLTFDTVYIFLSFSINKHKNCWRQLESWMEQWIIRETNKCIVSQYNLFSQFETRTCLMCFNAAVSKLKTQTEAYDETIWLPPMKRFHEQGGVHFIPLSYKHKLYVFFVVKNRARFSSICCICLFRSNFSQLNLQGLLNTNQR